jgi:putative transposase
MRFAFIDAEKAHYSTSIMCRLLMVSRSGYYSWCCRPESKRSKDDRSLEIKVRAAYEAGRKYYGSPRIHAELQAQGTRIGRNRVIRLMNEQGLRAKSRRRFKNTTKSDPELPVAPNLLNREFKAERPNQRWVCDTTELIIPGKRLFLAVVLDLFSRFVIGWSLSTRNDRYLTIQALSMALGRRNPDAGLIHHSDRGSTYAAKDFQEILSARGITCSMSRSGNCLDNAAMESWNSTLKSELGESFESESAARKELFDYIEVFYNQKRRHSTLEYFSPAEFERRALRGITRRGPVPSSCSSPKNEAA